MAHAPRTSLLPPSMPPAAQLLQAMVGSGMSDEMLGKAVRELLQQPQKWQVEVVEPDAGHRAPSRRRELAMVKFKNAQGVESSVSVSQTLLRDFARAGGGMKQARIMVKELAQRAPRSTVNRSGWVTDQLARKLAQMTAEKAAEAKTEQAAISPPAAPPLPTSPASSALAQVEHSAPSEQQRASAEPTPPDGQTLPLF